MLKDDPELKFDDDDVDDNMLAAMLPDPVTKPRSNPSCATSTETENPVLSLPCAAETGTAVTQAHATTSRVTTNPRQELPQTPITGHVKTQTADCSLTVQTADHADCADYADCADWEFF